MASPENATATDQEQEVETFTLRQRLIIFLVSWLGFLAVRLIGPTLRWRVSIEEGGPPVSDPYPCIFSFWHRCVFLGTWWYRKHGIAVMTSSSFDGEYIARIIEKFGFLAVRGSSTRGGARALLGLQRAIEQGHVVAFTIDGPKGPPYVAKRGPVVLARRTGVPIYCFHVALEKAWVLKTWDRFMIPKPFSHALVKVGRPVSVPREATPEDIERYHQEMQATLDRIRIAAEQEMTAATGHNA